MTQMNAVSNMFQLDFQFFDLSTPSCRRERRKLRRATGDNALEILASRNGLSKEAFQRDDRGQLKHNDAYISKSYTNGLGVVALSNMPIGIDLEQNSRDRDITALSNYLWREQIKDPNEFYRRFCRMEAWGKLIGEGISAKSRSIPAIGDTITQLNQEGYIFDAQFNDVFLSLAIAKSDHLLNLIARNAFEQLASELQKRVNSHDHF